MESSQQPHWFTTTHWSVVLAAGNSSTVARGALEELCGRYWYPLYAYTRRVGRSPEDAQDLVQEFFRCCIEKNYLAAADREKGRFRSFLLTAFKRFLANEWDKRHARKRGGSAEVVSLDGLTAEQRYALEPADSSSPEVLYERKWALTLLDNVLERLRTEHRGNAQFEKLKAFLTSRERGTPYAEVGRELGMTESAVKVAIHRIRKRYRELLEEAIAQTVASPEEVEEERRHLLRALSE